MPGRQSRSLKVSKRKNHPQLKENPLQAQVIGRRGHRCWTQDEQKRGKKTMEVLLILRRRGSPDTCKGKAAVEPLRAGIGKQVVVKDRGGGGGGGGGGGKKQKAAFIPLNRYPGVKKHGCSKTAQNMSFNWGITRGEGVGRESQNGKGIQAPKSKKKKNKTKNQVRKGEGGREPTV